MKNLVFVFFLMSLSQASAMDPKVNAQIEDKLGVQRRPSISRKPSVDARRITVPLLLNPKDFELRGIEVPPDELRLWQQLRPKSNPVNIALEAIPEESED
jgi:hypothetical protein